MDKIINYKELMVKANEQITRLKEWYKEHEEAFDYMDLKLHGVSYYCYTDMKKDFPLCYAEQERMHRAGNYDTDYFSDFCESEYGFFEEDMLWQYDIKVGDYHYQLNRTSKFWLHDRNVFDTYKRTSRLDWEETVINIVIKYSCSYGEFLKYNEEGMVIGVLDKDYEDENIDELNFLVNDMYNDVTKDFEDMFKVYKYIKDFKDNQVENFKSYLECREYDLRVVKDKEEAEDKKCDELLNKFGVSEELHRRLKVLGSTTLEMMETEFGL